MTTIAAIARDGQVWMAADSGTTVYDRRIATARKIVELDMDGERVLLGVSGDGRWGHLLRSGDFDVIPASDADPVNDDWAGDVAHLLTQVARAEDIPLDSYRMLLGFQGRVWTITNGQAISHADGLAAIGTGEGPAMGVLLTWDGIGLRAPYDEPAAAVSLAVQYAISLDVYSNHPITTATTATEVAA